VASEALRSIHAKVAIEEIQAFIRENPIQTTVRFNRKGLIDEGRE
jgi:hypothetical protein